MFKVDFQTNVIEIGATISDDAQLGCFVKVCSGASLGKGVVLAGLTVVPPHVHIAENSYIGRGVNFIEPVGKAAQTLVGKGARIGDNAVVSAGVAIGDGAVVAPLTLVQKSIPNMAIVEGSPARIVGYVGAGSGADLPEDTKEKASLTSNVRGVTLFRMKNVIDIRGNLTVGEFGRDIPFPPKRYFVVYGVPSSETRGEHAHRECHQFLVCVRGNCSVVADDGICRQEFFLDRPDLGLHLPPMTWGIQYKYSLDAVLLVFASDYYDAADYIRNYGEFRALAAGKR